MGFELYFNSHEMYIKRHVFEHLMPQAITIQDVYDELKEIKQNMVSKQEVESLIETMEILHNPLTMAQVRASEADIKAGRTKPVKSMKDLLAEL